MTVNAPTPTGTATYRKSLWESHSEPYLVNADKRKAVETLLADETWAKWSDVKVAAACGVTEAMVRSHRTERSDERTYTDRHGNTSIDSACLTRQTGAFL